MIRLADLLLGWADQARWEANAPLTSSRTCLIHVFLPCGLDSDATAIAGEKTPCPNAQTLITMTGL